MSNDHDSTKMEIIPLFFAKLAEKIEDVFWVRSPDYKKQFYVSPSFEIVWGRTCQSLYDNPDAWSSYLHPEDKGELEKQIATERMDPTIPHANTKYYEYYRIVRPDGEIRHIKDHSFPLFDAQKKLIAFAGIARDVTQDILHFQELKAAKETAETVTRLQTEFLENMRHDIRTPLTGIIGFSNLIKEEVKEKKIKEYAENLALSSHTLMDFLNEVLESIQTISGENPVLKQKFDLKAKLEHIIQLNQAVAYDKKLSLQLAYDNKIPKYLVGDGKRIYRIILELVTNALKFTAKGNVTIAAELAKVNSKQGNNTIIQIKVSDTGMGIPKGQQQEIFTRFHRLTPASQGIYSGLGMGLAVVKQFIDDLGAEIYVDSTPNEGATFTCIIPLKKALLDDDVGIDRSLEAMPITKTKPKVSKRSDTAHKSTITQTGRAHILIVEDQPFAAQVVERVLTNLACNVDVAKNGKTALEYVQNSTYDLIFMDVGLPDIDGCEVTKRVRLKERGTAMHVPIIALTAHVDTENKQSCIEAGMDAVFSKPLSKEKAQDILHAFIPTQIQTLSPEAAKLLHVEGEVIDLDLGAKIMEADHDTAKQMITLLLESADSDLKTLESAHKVHDWAKIQELAHKLRGGAAYCGTPRLYQAFSHLNDYLKDGQRELAEPLYQQAIAEMIRVKAEYHHS